MQEPEFYREQLRKLRAEPAAIEPMLTRKQYLATPSARLGYVLPPGYEKHMQIQRDGEARDAGAEQRRKVASVLRGKYERQAQHAAAQARREQLEASIGTRSWRRPTPARPPRARARRRTPRTPNWRPRAAPTTPTSRPTSSRPSTRRCAPTLAFDPAPPRAPASRSEPVMTTSVARTFEVTLSGARGSAAAVDDT